MTKDDAFGIAYMNGYKEGKTEGYDEALAKICFCAECVNIVGTFQTDEKCYCRFVRGMVEPCNYCSFGKKAT